MKNFEGIIPPIVTPFTREGEIDERKIRKEMEICMKAGANGLSVAGSTGEGPTLNDSDPTVEVNIKPDVGVNPSQEISSIRTICKNSFTIQI